MPDFNLYAALTMQEMATKLKTSIDRGLTSEQAKELGAHYGPNVLQQYSVSFWKLLWKQISSPFIYVLIIIAIIDFILHEFTDGIMILIIVVINTLFSFYQEYRTYHALQLLKHYLKDQIHVVRDGKEIIIDTSEIVPGDSIKLYPGDRIPADVRFTAVNNCMIDESILTGESTPVQKNTDVSKKSDVSLFEATNIGFSGTTISSGSATGIVFAIGDATYFGSIAQLAQTSPHISSFTKGIAQFSKFILYLILITISVVFVMHLLWNKQFSLVNLIVFSLALGISIIPEALPIVITFSLARGALHLAKYKVITKRLAAIEDLGSMQVLCIDKTGTITENVLMLRNVYGADEQETLFYAVLASGLSPAQLAQDKGFNGPLWQKLADEKKSHVKEYTVQAEHPFEPQLRYTSLIACHQNSCELIVRGNIHETLPLCTNLTEQQRQDITQWTHEESSQAHRVLLIAKKEVPANITHIAKEDEMGVTFVGLISYDDPIKPTAEHALTRAHNLGVQIKIISGDTAEVNFAVAQKIKLITSVDQIITGEEFATKSEPGKREIVQRCKVFAHIVPSQKVEIVQLLENIYDTGYLGDGINDAPALKIAHVSMAVDTAVDVARDVADVILLHKSLRVIVDGIHEGRVIFANIIKYIKSTLAANFGHFYAIAILSLFIDFLPLQPVQLLLISLLTDLPLIAIATDTVSLEDINAPQRYDLKDIAFITMVLGLVVMLADFIIFKRFYTVSPAVLQTNWFIASILIELSFFYSIRTRSPFYKAPFPSPYVLSLTVLVACTALIVPFTEFGQRFLHFHSPTLHDLLFIGAVVIGYFILTDVIKVLFYRVFRQGVLIGKSYRG